jgi:hypothetical protein
MIEALASFDTMKWFEILSASGGRSSGNNSHFIEVDRLARGAQTRLIELNLDDQDRLFSLRLQGVTTSIKLTHRGCGVILRLV